MHMPKLAMFFGIALIAVSAAVYPNRDPEKSAITAFIPAILGVLLLLCGLIAQNDKLRMHAMHFAALLGLAGTIAPLVRAIPALAGGASINWPLGGQLATSALSAVFLALCVKSFIDVRRARKAREGAGHGV